MTTELERIYLTSGAQPTTRKEIEQQIQREARYRRHLMTTEPDASKRRVAIAASTKRSQELAKRRDRTP